MAAEHDVEMTEGEHVARAYLVIDTNILIECLPTVQALFRILSLPTLDSALQILIPATVLYELDNHHKHGNEQVRHRARDANRFLNRTYEARKHDPRVPLRIQKVVEMSEHLRTKAMKQDDQHILDCCLVFKGVCQEIWLWTKDQIFGTIAESNDIPVLDKSDLYGIVLAVGMLDDPLVREAVRFYESRSSREATPEDNTGMEVDEDLYFDLPALANERKTPSNHGLAPGPDGNRSLLDDYWARYSGIPPPVAIEPFDNAPPSFGGSSGFSTPMRSITVSRPASAQPVKLSVYDIHDRLEVLLQPLMTYIAATSPRSDRYLHSLLDRLTQTESSLFPNAPERLTVTEAQQTLLVGIDATRTLVRYCEKEMHERGARPRSGEVAEAIECLGDLCLSIGLGEDVRVGCIALATAVRAS